MIWPSSSSAADGRHDNTAPTAATEASSESKCSTITPRRAGSGTKCTTASVTQANVPSAPTINFARLKFAPGNLSGLAAPIQCDVRRHGKSIAALRHEFVEIVAAHSPQNRRKPRNDLLMLGGNDPLDRAINVAPTIAASLLGQQLLGGKRAKRRRRRVGGQHGELQNIVDHLSVSNRVRAGRVVADHAADVRAVARRHVGAELQSMRGGGRVELIQHDARLDARRPRAASKSTIRLRYLLKSTTIPAPID